MAHAQRIDEAFQRYPAPLLDGGKQIAHRGFAIAFDLFELELAVALLQREDIRRLPHPFLIEEVLQLLLAEPVDVEGSARHEQFQVLDLLVREETATGEEGSRTTSVCSGHGHLFG